MGITGYLISIVGICVASVIVELVLPEGSMSQFVKRMCALIVVFVIMAPIPGLIKQQNFNLSFGQNESQTTINSDLLVIINRQKATELERTIVQRIKEQEGLEVDVIIVLDLGAAEFKPDHVTIRTYTNNFDIERIQRIVRQYILIEENQIFIV